jgi:hypothetical protein
MANYTLTYSTLLNGWTSFHSYFPDWMANMNNNFYTFIDGDIWKHNTNPIYNNFYGTQYNSSVRTIFNDAPDEQKMFKTLQLEASDSWGAQVLSNLGSGNINNNSFVKKEGAWFAYIRREDNESNTVYLSAQGISEVLLVSSGVGFVDITFVGKVGENINLNSPGRFSGDIIYRINGALTAKAKSGMASARTYNAATNRTVIRIVADVLGTLVAPAVGDFILSVKNSVSESFGLRGYYMEVQLDSTNTDSVEVFQVSSEVFKSYP